MIKLKRYNSIGEEEKLAAHKVIETGILSQFIGAPGEDFLGGPMVRSFEAAWEEYFKVEYAISVNSWTSGLICAVGAMQFEPGDEIITTPWTMCATATSILHWNLVPIFADIDPVSFNIDPKSVEEKISERTKAILTVDIFGRSSDYSALKQLCKKYSLKLLSDTAQAPGLKIGSDYVGTQSDIGGYSLNYHKHINTGEGGVIVTNNADLAEKCRLIRNHAEACMNRSATNKQLVNMLGFNFRLGEIEAAIGIEQLKKLPFLLKRRQIVAKKLIDGLRDLKGLDFTQFEKDLDSAFYILPMVLSGEALKVGRRKIVSDLNKIGVPLIEGYQNIHQLPVFQEKIAFGNSGVPWSFNKNSHLIDYGKGSCRVAEELQEASFMGFEICAFSLEDNDIEYIVKSFKETWVKNGIY